VTGIDGMVWTAFIFLQETRRVPVYVFYRGAYKSCFSALIVAARVAVSKLIGKVPDASGFALIMRVASCLSR
jgi:hypothetical protein